MKKYFNLAVFVGIGFSAQTKIIAHRGFWQTQPPTTENSIQSLKNAQSAQFYGSEFDVRMTKDGKLVVNHDEHHGALAISEHNYSALKKIKLSNGEEFPKLKNYLKQGKLKSDVKLIVEIKPCKTKIEEDQVSEKTLNLIDKLNLTQQCEFISFSKNICLKIKQINPNVKVSYLNGDLSPTEIKDLKLDGIDYHYKIFTEKHPEWLQQAKALGLITNAWTVNDTTIYQQLKEEGIDFVTTNIPDQLSFLK